MIYLFIFFKCICVHIGGRGRVGKWLYSFPLLLHNFLNQNLSLLTCFCLSNYLSIFFLVSMGIKICSSILLVCVTIYLCSFYLPIKINQTVLCPSIKIINSFVFTCHQNISIPYACLCLSKSIYPISLLYQNYPIFAGLSQSLYPLYSFLCIKIYPLYARLYSSKSISILSSVSIHQSIILSPYSWIPLSRCCNGCPISWLSRYCR